MNLLLAFIAGISLLTTTTSFGEGSEDPVEIIVGQSVENFHALVPGNLYRGARPKDLKAREALAAAGINVVINMQGGDKLFHHPLEAGEARKEIETERDFFESHHVQFLSIPLSAINPDVNHQTGKINFISKFLSENPQLKIFFHCHGGKDRTGLIAALYRMNIQGCLYAQAHTEMMKYGHAASLFWIDRYLWKNGSDPENGLPAATCPLELPLLKWSALNAKTPRVV